MAEQHGIEVRSPWWRYVVVITRVLGFSVLIALTIRIYSDAPPIPQRVMSPSGDTLFTGEGILGGQQVFLKYGLIENSGI